MYSPFEYNIIMENIATKKMKDLRARTGLSQSQFAKRFHLSIKTLQGWEGGIKRTPGHILYMVERILDLEERMEKENPDPKTDSCHKNRKECRK